MCKFSSHFYESNWTNKPNNKNEKLTEIRWLHLFPPQCCCLLIGNKDFEHWHSLFESPFINKSVIKRDHVQDSVVFFLNPLVQLFTFFISWLCSFFLILNHQCALFCPGIQTSGFFSDVCLVLDTRCQQRKRNSAVEPRKLQLLFVSWSRREKTLNSSFSSSKDFLVSGKTSKLLVFTSYSVMRAWSWKE